MIRASLATLAFLGLCLPLLSNASTKTTKTGYEVAIEGMTCAPCAKSVTKALQGLPDVDKGSVKVVLTENKAYLEMAKQDAALEAQIKQAVEKAGFKVASLNNVALRAAVASSKAEAKDAKKAEKHTCEDCGKEGHTCKECGEKGKAHSCADGKACKKDCTECAKKGHKHGEDHAGHHSGH